MSLRSVGHDVQHSLKQAFELPAKAVWMLFASGRHVLIAGLKSQTPMAREIQASLLPAEEPFRVNAAAEALGVVAEAETAAITAGSADVSWVLPTLTGPPPPCGSTAISFLWPHPCPGAD
jgi:hypothetical protein